MLKPLVGVAALAFGLVLAQSAVAQDAAQDGAFTLDRSSVI